MKKKFISLKVLLIFSLLNFNVSYAKTNEKPINIKIEKRSKVIKVEEKEKQPNPVPETSDGFDWNSSVIKWYGLEEGKKIALNTKKPTMIVFYTTWCPHCKKYSQLFKTESIVNLSKSLIMIKVNTDEVEVDTKFEPDGGYIPRTIFLDKKFEPNYEFHANRDKYKYFFDYDSTRELEATMKKVIAKYK